MLHCHRSRQKIQAIRKANSVTIVVKISNVASRSMCTEYFSKYHSFVYLMKEETVMLH